MCKVAKILIIFFFLNTIPANCTANSETSYFLTLKYNEVKVRQGPSFKHLVKFIYKKKYLPLRVIDVSDNFKKIIDIKNNDGWIHVSQLSNKKSAINISNLSIVFSKPNIYSQPLLKLEKGKIVIIKKIKNNWCKVLVQNKNGWMQKKFLWGNF